MPEPETLSRLDRIDEVAFTVHRFSSTLKDLVNLSSEVEGFLFHPDDIRAWGYVKEKVEELVEAFNDFLEV